MRSFSRALIVTALGAGLSGATFGIAAAAQPSDAPSAGDVNAVRTLMHSDSTLNRLATTTFPDKAPVAAATAKRTAEVTASNPVAVYVPTADFVAGKSGNPGELAYVSAAGKLGNGEAATVWAHKTGSKWSVFNVASGTQEQDLAAKAGKGYLLQEPQTNTWYSVDGDQVRLLSSGLDAAENGKTMTVEQLQQQMHARYGDKLPGSSYDRHGAAGGYGPDSSASADGGSAALPVGLGGAAVLLGGAGVWGVRRARRA